MPPPPPDRASAIRVDHLGVVDSTMGEARRRIAAGAAGAFAVFADVQERGYGRLGRVWQSPRGGLWMTVALPGVEGDGRASAALAAGIACARAAARLIGEEGDAPGRVRLKWPNDVLIDGRKVCGVLCEGIESGGRAWLLVGAGMNVNNEAGRIDGHLRRPAGSIIDVTGRETEVAALASHLAGEIARLAGSPLGREDLGWAARRLWRLDERVTVRTPGRADGSASLRGLNDAGRPIVEIDGVRRAMADGEELVL